MSTKQGIPELSTPRDLQIRSRRLRGIYLARLGRKLERERMAPGQKGRFPALAVALRAAGLGVSR